MPQLWAYGGGVFDEATANPTYKPVELDSAQSKAALQASYDMYVRDKSVPVSALTNQQADNQPLFLAELAGEGMNLEGIRRVMELEDEVRRLRADRPERLAYVVGFSANDISVLDLTPKSATQYHLVQRIGFPSVNPR